MNKLLLVGNDTVDTLASMIGTKYPQMSVSTAKTIAELKYAISRGESIDRLILSDTILLEQGYNINNPTGYREYVQRLMAILKQKIPGSELKVVNIIIAIATTQITGQYFLEELYDVDFLPFSTVFIRPAGFYGSEVTKFVSADISELKAASNMKVMKEIYQSNDDVIWSSTKTEITDWQDLEDLLTDEYSTKATFILHFALEVLEFLLKPAGWEYKDKRQENLEPIRNAATTVNQSMQSVQQVQQTPKKEKKHGIIYRLFHRKSKEA